MMMDVLIVGGGASGLMAAGFCAREGLRTLLLERGPKCGRKLAITGKGRCNITNNSDTQAFIRSVPQNGRFLYSAASRFTAQDTMAFFVSRGVALKTERGARVFPQSDNAEDIVNALVRSAKEDGAQFQTGRAVHLLQRDGVVTGVSLEDGREIHARTVLVCTGGLSYPGTGSTGDGYLLAKEGGHTIVDPVASLVPLVAAGGWCKEAQGLSLRNTAITVLQEGKEKPVYTDFGEMLFTHFGVSGPMILSASAHMRDMKKNRYTVLIDLKPALSPQQLDARLLRDFSAVPNRNFSNVLGGLLPAKLIGVILSLGGIAPDTKVNAVTREQRAGLVQLLKALPVRITGTRPVAEAIITSGGVSVKEIDPKTMQSKLTGGLYFAGEVLDVDGYTGGFNLQIAFCTAVAAARGIKEAINR